MADDTNAKFAEARDLARKAKQDFDAAHQQGMADLKDGDVAGVQEAIDQEKAAVEKFQAATDEIFRQNQSE